MATSNPARDPASDGPSRAWKTRLLSLISWLGLAVAAVVIPIGVLSNLLDQASESLRAAGHAEQQERVGSLLRAVDQAIDADDLLQEFLDRLTRVRLRRGLDPSLATTWERYLVTRCRLPAKSRFFWFDERGGLITGGGRDRQIISRRGWQSLYKAFSGGGGMSPRESREAEKLIGLEFGRFATVNYLSRTRRHVVEVISRGKPTFLGMIRFTRSGPAARPAGGLVVLIPKTAFPRDWEVRAVVRRFLRHGRQVGVMRLSSERLTHHPQLTPGILWGMGQRLIVGRSTYREAGGGRLLAASFSSHDPDLVLLAAEPRLGAHLDAVTKIETVGQAARAGAAGLLVVFFCLGAGWIRYDPGLTAKFFLGVFLLTGLPLGAMGTAGIQRFLHVQLAHRDFLARTLERTVEDIEQSVSDGYAEMAARLVGMMARPDMRFPADPRHLDEMVEDLRRFGLKWVDGYPAATVREGVRYHQGFGISASSKVAEFLDSFTATMLENIRFPLDRKAMGIKASQEVEAVMSSTASDSLRAARSFNRLEYFSIGGIDWFIFRGLTRDERGGLNGYYGFTFDSSTFNRFYLDRASRTARTQGSFVRIRPYGRRGRPGLISRMLRQAESQQGQIRQTFRTPAGEWMAMARPLRLPNLVAVVAMPMSEFPNVAAWFTGLLIFLGGWAVAGAFVFVAVMRRALLEPVLTLAAAVGRLEGGDYQASAPVGPQDELGVLARRFNDLAKGLQEKARMGRFLREDLVARAGERERAVALERQCGMVCFAGLRRFADLESSLSAEQALQVMSEFLGLCEITLQRHGGKIDKFIGDTAMAVFLESGGRPAEEAALPAVVDLAARLEPWRAGLAARGIRLSGFGVGMAKGVILAGGIGSARKRLDFTVIGDPVNLAARLEKVAGTPGMPSILVEDTGMTGVPPGLRKRFIELALVRGRAGGVKVFTPEPEDRT